MRRIAAHALVFAVLLGFSSAANALAPIWWALIKFVVVPAVVAGPSVFNQMASWGVYRESQPLTPEQVTVVKQSIDYLERRGLADVAKQAQSLLDHGLLRYTKPWSTRNPEDKVMAVTYGGPKNALFKDSWINLRGVLSGFSTDGPLENLSDQQKIRARAKTLLHELQHLNKQSNSWTHLAWSDILRDEERYARPHHLSKLRDLGYSTDEIKAIRQAHLDSKETDLINLVPIIDAELAKPDPSPPALAEPAPSPSPSAAPAPGGEGANIPGPTPPSLGTRPQRAPLPPFAPPALPDYLQPGLPKPTPDQIAAAQGLSGEAGGGIPQKKSKGAQKGAKQGGYQDPATDVAEGPPRDKPPAYVDTCPQVDQTGKVLAWVPCPPGIFPGTPLPADQTAKRPGDRPGAKAVDKRAPTPPVGPGTPPVVIGQAPPVTQPPPVTPPSVPGTKTPPAKGAQCSPPLCREMSEANCNRTNTSGFVRDCAQVSASLPSCFGLAPGQRASEAQYKSLTPEKVQTACFNNMLKRCEEGEAGGTGDWCVRKGADATCVDRARRVCG